MSGHSKWSTIKRHKAAQDQARSKLFTKLGNAITVAVKTSGGNTDPESNIRLREAIDQARQNNMPKDRIKKAIDRGSGKSQEGKVIEEVVYEGFAPYGVAVMVEAVTDNKQRTIAMVKNFFSTQGGNLGSSGSVGYLFIKIGRIEIDTQTKLTEDQLLEHTIAAGASDLVKEAGIWVIYTQPEKLHQIKQYLLDQGITISSSEISFKAKTSIELTDRDKYDKIVNFLADLEELDDIQKVHANLKLA